MSARGRETVLLLKNQNSKTVCQTSSNLSQSKTRLSATSVPNLVLIQGPISKLKVFIGVPLFFELPYGMLNCVVAQYLLHTVVQ